MGKQILIDAMLLRDEWLYGTINEPCYSPIDVLDSIYWQPTIDPESLPIVQELREENERLKQDIAKREIIHAHWRYDIEEKCFICSNCDEAAMNNWRGMSAKTPYCSHCGAMMDEEE